MKKLKHEKWFYMQLFFIIAITSSFLIGERANAAVTALIFGNYIFPITAILFMSVSILLKDEKEIFDILYFMYAVAFYANFGNLPAIYWLLLVLTPIFCMLRIYQLYKRKHRYNQYFIPILLITFVFIYLTSLVY